MRFMRRAMWRSTSFGVSATCHIMRYPNRSNRCWRSCPKCATGFAELTSRISQESFPMENRVALLSGASGGIGASIAQILTQRGWSLSLGARDPESLAQNFPDAHVVRHDATARDEAEWVGAARARFGRIDAVICSAGVTSPHDVVEIEDEALERMWEINVKSPRRLVRAAWPDLCACGQGRVILLVSLS